MKLESFTMFTGPYPKHFYPIPLRSILISFSLLHVGLPSDLFPLGFPTKTLYANLLSCCACYMLHQSPLFDLIVPIIFIHQHNSWSSSFRSFLQSLSPRPLDPCISLSTTGLLSNTLSLCSSLRLKDQIRYPHKTSGRYIISYIVILILPDCTVTCPKYQ